MFVHITSGVPEEGILEKLLEDEDLVLKIKSLDSCHTKTKRQKRWMLRLSLNHLII